MKIYKQNGALLVNVTVDDNSYRHREIMGDNSLTLYFSLSEHLEIPLGAYVEFENEQYFLMRPEALKMQHTRCFDYTVTLESSQAKSKIWKFRNPVDGRLKFSLTAKPIEHLQMFVDNMNIRDRGWTVGKCIDGVEQCVNYDHAYCWDALGQIAEEFKTEFEIVGKTVSLGKVEYNKTSPLPLAYGRGNGFKSGVGRSNYSDTPPIEVLYAQGGTENIDPSEYGSSELHLPKNGVIRYDGEKFEDENGFDDSKARAYLADDKGFSVRRIDGELSSLAEDSLDCTEVYPKRVGVVSDVVCVDADSNFYDIVDTSIPDSLNYEECLIEGETMTVIFQSGMLAGKEFEVKYYHNAISTKTGQKKGRRFEIVPQEIDGQTMPNETFAPRTGDAYAVFHCMLPKAYINAYERDGDPKTGAEWDMLRQCVKYLYDNEEQNFSFTGTLDGIWAKKDWLTIGGKILLGGFVRFSDDRFQKEGVLIRIIGIKDYINNPHSPELELSNSTVTGSFGTTLQTLSSSEVIAEEYHRNALQFTKRRFRDAKETMGMLEQALMENFTNSISPITIQTMSLLVGDESLQFRFVNSTDTPNMVEPNITWDNANKQIHCPAGIIQHMTMGVDSISPSHEPSEYRFWRMGEYISGSLGDGENKYYLYAKVAKTPRISDGSFLLSETAIKIESNSDLNNYYLLVGVLNSEYDGERSFVPLYGFTEVLPGRITTDKIVSSEGNSYFDMVANAMKLGDALDFNSQGDGQLRLKGTIVQSLSGESNYIGCYRGEYNPNYTYFKGDEVTYAVEGCTSTYRYIAAEPNTGKVPTNTTYWQVIAQGTRGQQGENGADGKDGQDGKDGISPNTSYKSTVFKRTNTAPSKPTGGSYDNPVPSGWSDGIPSGETKLWASTRIFSSDGLAPQQAEWTTPRQMTDTADFDVEFSSVENPNAPVGHPNTNTQWSNTSDETTIWMATARKKNGLWEDWQVSRIRGESGQDGTSVSIKGTCYNHFSNIDDWSRSSLESTVLIDKIDNPDAQGEYLYNIVYVYTRPRPQSALGWVQRQASLGDAYLMSRDGSDDGCLYVASENGWLNVGRIKGDQGQTGSDGKSAYIHIKYAKSMTTNDWSDNNGETPDAYIGVYCDNSPTDKLDWSLYQWSKWKGEDGFGYEYIYKRTTNSTAPSTPTTTSQADEYVPTGWTDDPTGVNASYPYEWICYRKKTDGKWGSFIGSKTNNAKAALWAKFGQDGQDGADGADGQDGANGQDGGYTELRFAKSGSTTSAPTLNTTQATPIGWSTSTPSVGVAEYLWMTSAKKKADGTLVGTWSTPVRMSGRNGSNGQNGKDGKSPAMVFRGDYQTAATYYGTDYRLDCVRHNGAYYIARIDAGTFSSVAPPDSTKWNAFGASFESVATQLLLAENANIAGWIFRNGRLESEAKDKDGTPMAFLNGKTGDMRLRGVVQFSTAYSGDYSDANLFYLPSKSSGTSYLSMGYELEDIGKVVRLYNSSPIGGGVYMISANEFEIQPQITISASSYSVICAPQEIVEMTCFERTGSKEDGRLGAWVLTGRFGVDDFKTSGATGRFPRALAMGVLWGSASKPYFSGNMWNGKSIASVLSVRRNKTGDFVVSFPSGTFPSGYFVFFSGKNGNWKGSIYNQSDTGFNVYVADGASLNNGDVNFIVFDPNWYYKL